MAISGCRGGGDCSVATSTLLAAPVGGKGMGGRGQRASQQRKGLPISPIKIDGMQCTYAFVIRTQWEGVDDDGSGCTTHESACKHDVRILKQRDPISETFLTK